MERIYHHISFVRNKLLCFNPRSVTTRKVNKIDPLIRNALVTTIQDEMNHNIIDENDNDYSNTNTNNNLSQSIQQIEKDIQIATIQFNNAIEKEKFISLRSHQYNKVLDELAYRIKILQQEQVKNQQQEEQAKNQQQKDNQEEVDDDNEKEEEEEIEKVDVVDVDDIESNVVVCTTHNDNNNNNNDDDDTTDAIDRNYDNIKNDVKSPVDDTTTTITTTTTNTSNITNKTSSSSSSIHIEQMIIKWETNMNSLENIRNIHKHILITIESLRQKIHNLQQQYEKLLKMQQECTTFIHIVNSTTIPDGTTLNNPSITTIDQHDDSNDNIESNIVGVDDDNDKIHIGTAIETSTTTTTTTTTNIDESQNAIVEQNNNNSNNQTNRIVEIEMIHTISSMEEGTVDKESV